MKDHRPYPFRIAVTRFLFTIFAFALVLTLGAARGSAEPAAGGDFEALLAAYESPSVGGAVAVHDLALRSGHLTLYLEAGTVAPVEAGGEAVGFFFTGRGRFEYVSSDVVESSVLSFNTRKVTSLELVEEAELRRLRGPVERVLLIGQGTPLPALEGEAGPPPQEAFQAHRDHFGTEWGEPAAFALVQARLDSPSQQLVRIELSTGKDDLVHTYDAVREQSEILVCLRTIGLRMPPKKLWAVVLSSQPIGRQRGTFVHPLYLLTDLTYTLRAPQKGEARLAITETLVPQLHGQRVYRFDLYNFVYDNGRRERDFVIEKITDETGRSLPFAHRNHSLVVGLPEEVAANSAFRLHFDIHGDFLVHPGGDTYWQLGVEPWFPQPPLSGQYYTVHSTLEVEAPFVPFAPGKTLSRREEEGFHILESEIDKPVQFTIAQAGRYFYTEEQSDGLTVRVASYGGKNPQAFKKLASLAIKMIRFYEPWLGPFPFDEFNILEINELGWGQAPPATMFITREAFTPQTNRGWTQGVNARFAHEIAHQYWGHVVKMGSYQEQWITESFAEYCSSLVMRQLKGQSGYKAMVGEWELNAKSSYDKAPIPLANRLLGVTNDSFIHRTYLLYDKGAYVLAKLHEELGEDMFLSFLRSYQGIFAWKFGTTRDMIFLLQKLTGKDYTDFFEENFWGTALPEVGRQEKKKGKKG